MAVKGFLFLILPLAAAVKLHKVLQILWMSVSSIIKEEVGLEAAVFKHCLWIPRAMRNQQVLMEEGRLADGTWGKDHHFFSCLHIDLRKI